MTRRYVAPHRLAGATRDWEAVGAETPWTNPRSYRPNLYSSLASANGAARKLPSRRPVLFLATVLSWAVMLGCVWLIVSGAL